MALVVDGFANLRRESKEGNDLLPMMKPRPANRRILLVPLLGELD
jgi:hypothetical protein